MTRYNAYTRRGNFRKRCERWPDDVEHRRRVIVYYRETWNVLPEISRMFLHQYNVTLMITMMLWCQKRRRCSRSVRVPYMDAQINVERNSISQTYGGFDYIYFWYIYDSHDIRLVEYIVLLEPMKSN